MDAGQLHDLIEKSLHGRASQQEMHYMYQFADTKDAWTLSMQLFSSPSEQVRYFAANLVYTKVKKDWSQLSVDQQTGLLQELKRSINLDQNSLGYIGASPGLRAFLGRVILSYAYGSARSPVTLRVVIKEAVDLIVAAMTVPEQAKAGYVALCLDLLAAVPSEVESLSIDVSRELSRQLIGILKESCDAVVSNLHVLVSREACCSSSKDVVVAVLRATRAWSCAGLNITTLHSKHPALLENSIKCALESGDPGATKQACMALKECLASPDPQVMTNVGSVGTRAAAVKRVVTILGGAWSIIARHFEDTSDDSVVAEICNMMAFLGSNEAIQICSPEGLEPTFFAALLFVAAQRPQRLACVTFDVWLSIQDIPVANRHPFTTQEVFYKLLAILLQQSSLPATFTSWEDGDEDEDDFVEFRSSKSGLQDVLLVCFYALDDVFFKQLGEFAGAPEAPHSWIKLEAVLFILQSVASGLKSNLQSQKSGVAVNFLAEALRRVLQWQPDNTVLCHSQLADTACRFMASATFVLTRRPSTPAGHLNMNDFLLPCLEYAFKAIRVPQAAPAAARAILQLSVHGSSLLSSRQDVVPGLVAATAQLITANDLAIPSDAVQTCVEAATRLGITRDFASSSATVSHLGLPMVAELQKACHFTTTNGGQRRERVGHVLGWLGQLIRFCDTACAGPDGSHVLGPTLAGLWPLLQGCTSSPLIMAGDSIVNAVFNVYSRAISSAEDAVMPHISSIGETVVTVFDHHGQATCLQCASVIVECLASKASSDTQVSDFLSNMLVRIVQSFDTRSGDAASPMANVPLWGFDPDGIDHVFKFLHTYLVHAPAVLSNSPARDVLPGLAHRCLLACPERAPVRTILHCMQAYFYPVSPRLEPLHGALLGACVPLGPAFVQYLLAALGGRATSTLWPNLTDTLYNLISGCCRSGQAGTDSVRQWLGTALDIPGVMDGLAAAPNVKTPVVEALVRLAANDRPRFKSLVQDLSKVCAKEADAGVLRDYML